MVSYEQKLKAFAIELFKINGVKFGSFKIKTGLMSPVYCDLRVLVSYPDVMDKLTDLLVEKINKMNCFNLICGVPYTALPIASVVSMKIKKPMVMRRQEAKSYGTKKLIEGAFKEGDTCLIVEDVVTSGSSVLETVRDLEFVGIKATDVIVLLNREQGGEHILKQKNVTMHALLTITQLVTFLEEEKCIERSMVDEVKSYIASNQVDSSILTKTSKNRLQLAFEDRAKLATNPVATKLFNVMAQKQTTLCVAADLTSATDILNLAEEIGPHICLLKTHIDIVEDFHENFIKHLKDIAKRHNFLLFEDRKFADIGKTVELQYSKGLYHISSWASLVTCHSLTGKGVLDAIKQVKSCESHGVFLLAETSAAGSLIDEKYTKATLKLASEYSDLVVGIVCQNPLFTEYPGLLQLTPGVQLDVSKDNLGQQYNSPEAVVQNGADIAVVGRGVTKAENPKEAALKYQKLLWQAYEKRVK